MKKTKISLENKIILVTGAAGFIGAALAERLLLSCGGVTVVGADNMNPYYDPSLKEYRLSRVRDAAEKSGNRFEFVKGSIDDASLINGLFEKYDFDIVVNLAAQAGVRYSIENPGAYISSNIVGFFNILEACRRSYEGGRKGVEHLVYASSSSVYGGNTKVPFAVEDNVDSPVSFYAATKKSNELMAHAYSKLYNIPATGLRFFTVYGEAGRPDMFYFTAADRLVKGEKISIFNHGNCKRDFTYIDDIVEGVFRVMQGAPEKATGADGLPLAPHAVYNIGGGNPENLLDFIKTLEDALIEANVLPADFDFDAHSEYAPMQPGDVPVTYADCSALEEDYGFTPRTGIDEGLRRFARWYKNYYNKED